MSVVKEFRTAADFWSGMVEPDYRDCLNDPADLRAAFHAAISLFHMHDWVWETDQSTVRANFNFTESGLTNVPKKSTDFANALERQYPDFGLVRGIANAAKHLELKPPKKNLKLVHNAPRHATNTSVQIEGGWAGWNEGPGGYGEGNWGYAGRPRVVLKGSPDIEFSDIAKSVYQMWQTLRAKHGR